MVRSKIFFCTICSAHTKSPSKVQGKIKNLIAMQIMADIPQYTHNIFKAKILILTSYLAINTHRRSSIYQINLVCLAVS